MAEHQNPFLEQEIDLRKYARVLYERRWIVISCTVIAVTLSLIYSFMMKPVYEASTKLLIEREAPKVVNIEEVASSDFSAREYYQTQYKILKSRAIAERVDKELGKYSPWSEWTGRSPRKGEPLTDTERLDSLLKRVAVKPVPNTQLVEITVSDINPDLAARISDLWAEKYIAYILDTRFEATRYASGWLQEKIKEAKDSLEKAEDRLQEYRRKHRIVETGSQISNPDVFNELLKRRASIEIEISEKSEHFRERHPEMIGLRSELGSISRKIESEKEKEIIASDVAIQYNILRRDVDTSRELYHSLLKRISETEVTGELKTTNIRVVDRASAPMDPSKPKKKQNLIIALLIGLFAGGGMAFLMENLDQSLKTPEDVKNHLKLASLAAIALPKTEEDKNAKAELITAERPRSTTSEAYRSLRTSVMFTAVEHGRKTLLITSSGPQEGKTTTAINLAIVMAQAGEKVLLMDADLRQPRIEKVFNFGKEHGITEILAGTEKFDSVVHKTDVDNLYVVACGTIPPNPSELLGSVKMAELLKDTASKFDRIIIDAPPALAVTDPVILSGMVDGTIIVIRANETNRHAVLKAKEMIEEVKSSRIIGAVLSMVETERTGGHYYYYRYYGKKYGHYGADKNS
ncbi:MAG: polysaccharide biosynthesis tyrosine autokinase [Candidatus Omnitrophota bacterium]